ncbi:Os05g0252050, partial [Oryza sativa Japonica Group]
MARLRQVMTQVMRNMFSWRVKGTTVNRHFCSCLASTLRRKKLRTVTGMLSAGTNPVIIWILMPTKQKTIPSSTATAMARGVTSQLKPGSGFFSNAASTDVSLGSPIDASMA